MKKYMWIVVLPYRSFPIVGALMDREEALHAARLIWFNAEVE